VLDDFDRALKAHADTLDSGETSGKNSGQDALAEGLELVHQKFRSAMEAKGLKPMDAVGKPFDTDHHEAVTQIPAPMPEQVGTVIEVCERGYFLHDAVLRFAKVVVGK
jgi:molecular chaperone GrpE